MVELRSDTFTRPSDGMRRAMARAEVGDDVYGEDPTVNALEEQAAAAVGKEAALFVSSGTMGNAIGVRLHAAQGDELYGHETAHILRNEAGGPAALWGVMARGLDGPDGHFDPATLVAALQDPDDPHHARSRLVCVENTATHGSGAPWPLERLEALAGTASDHGLALHMDGARLFNAATALGVDATQIARHVDTVQFCLSKGLGAPIGSILAGSAEEIGRARRLRKLLGGGTRQAGVIAAAGLYALEHNVERLHEDHENARRLAEGLAELPRLEVDVAAVRTNIVIASCARAGDSARAICADLAGVGVMAGGYDPTRVRFVTSLEVDRTGIEEALRAASAVLG
jgi:threonine aldolase